MISDHWITTCETCGNVTAATRKLRPSQWTCIKFPRVDGGSFVAPTEWSKHEPYNRCVNINLGHCPVWERCRDGQLEMDTNQDQYEGVK